MLIFAPMSSFQDKDLQSFVGNLLRYGVIIAMTIVIAGLLMHLFFQGSGPADFSHFDETAVFRFPDFYGRLAAGSTEAIMEAGIMVLIATPVARVLFTMIGFWLEKDYRYTMIAFVVLCIIAYSLLFGVAGH